MINKIHCGDNIELMRKLPDNSIDMVITSPPYWGLRDYGDSAEKVFGGEEDCEHEWRISSTRHQEAPGKTSLVKQKGLEYTVSTHTCKKCGAWKGQLGLEPHPQMYVDHMVELCREVKRILKPSGSFYLNIGDSYCSHNANSKNVGGIEGKRVKEDPEYKKSIVIGKKVQYDGGWLQNKQLLLVPSRVACALQEDGWILRNDNLWLKPNPMPISVKDRLNNTYEHIFHFVKKPHYFYNLDAIREPHKEHTISDGTRTDVNYKPDNEKGYHKDGEHTRKYSEFYHPQGKNPGDVIKPLSIQDHINKIYQISKQTPRTTYEGKHKDGEMGSSSALSSTATIRKVGREYIKENSITGQTEKEILNYIQSVAGHPLGKNPGDIFEVTVQPFADAHFAVFPPELVEKPLKSSCPERICVNCGTPWTYESITEVEHNRENKREDSNVRPDGLERVPNDWQPKQVLGQEWVKNCNCETDEYAPGIVLDIFNGSGTTCLVAKKYGRRYLGFDINPEYCKMAKERVGKFGKLDEWGNDTNYNFPIKEFAVSKRKKTKEPEIEEIEEEEMSWDI